MFSQKTLQLIWFYALAALLGVMISYIDLTVSGPQVPALLLLASGFLLAVAQPKIAWRLAVITGLWIPIIRIVLLFSTRSTLLIDQIVSPFLALIPTFLGTIIGLFFTKNFVAPSLKRH